MKQTLESRRNSPSILAEPFFASMKQKRDFFCCNETKSGKSLQLSFYFSQTVFCFDEAKAGVFLLQ
jgi:hypothetical protein